MVSVIMVQHNALHHTRKALSSFQRHHTSEYQIVLVDNASTDGGVQQLKSEFGGIKLIRNRDNIGFGAANNVGVRQATGDILLFLNNDTITTGESLSVAERKFSEYPDVGIIGPRLRNPNGSFQLSAGPLPNFGREAVDKAIYGLLDRRNALAYQWAIRRYNDEQNVGWVTGAALFILRSLFIDLGGFDESMFMYYEDKDLCLRAARAGKKVRYLPGVEFVHLKAGSSGQSPLAELNYRLSQKRYYALHRPRVEQYLLDKYLQWSGKAPD